MAKKRTVQRLITELGAWVARPRNREILSDFSTQSLINYLNGQVPSPNGALSGIGYWLGQNGAHRVLHNDQSGWREIATSLEYLSWNERTLVSMLEKGKAKSIQVVHSIFVLLHAICTGEEEIAIWFGSRLMSAFQKRDERITGWKEVSLYSFALHLFAKWRKLPFAYSQADAIKLGVYQELLDGWDNGTTFANCLVAACDYHVEQAFDDSEQDTQDFFYTLYNLFPVEILAIKRIRKLQGLSMPEIDHPLMKTSLANPPEQIPSSQDDILKEVILKVCKDFAITNSWKF